MLRGASATNWRKVIHCMERRGGNLDVMLFISRLRVYLSSWRNTFQHCKEHYLQRLRAASKDRSRG